MGELEELDFLKLMLAENAAGVLAGGSRFGTEAGSPGGDVNGQSLFRNGFVAIQVVQFDFGCGGEPKVCAFQAEKIGGKFGQLAGTGERSEEHTSELQSRRDLVCRLLLEKKKKKKRKNKSRQELMTKKQDVV